MAGSLEVIHTSSHTLSVLCVKLLRGGNLCISSSSFSLIFLLWTFTGLVIGIAFCGVPFVLLHSIFYI